MELSNIETCTHNSPVDNFTFTMLYVLHSNITCVLCHINTNYTVNKHVIRHLA